MSAAVAPTLLLELLELIVLEKQQREQVKGQVREGGEDGSVGERLVG